MSDKPEEPPQPTREYDAGIKPLSPLAAPPVAERTPLPPEPNGATTYTVYDRQSQGMFQVIASSIEDLQKQVEDMGVLFDMCDISPYVTDPDAKEALSQHTLTQLVAQLRAMNVTLSRIESHLGCIRSR